MAAPPQRAGVALLPPPPSSQPTPIPFGGLTSEPSKPARRTPGRILLFAAILAAESLLVAQIHHPWLKAQQLMATPIVFGAAFLFFARKGLSTDGLETAPVQPGFLLLHLFSLVAIAASSAFLLQASAPNLTAAHAAEAVWYAAILLVVLSLVAALFPLRRLGRMLLGLRSAWIYAALTTVVAMSARVLLRALWSAPDSRFGHALQVATFAGVRWLLERFYTGVVAIPGDAVLGTSRFLIRVAGTCSGIEGLALTLILTTGWILFDRRQLRVARALWLVPLALVLSWLLNLVRIAALVAIGDAGHPGIALNGFHSEAGWILFNAVAIGFLLAVEHLPWLRKDQLRQNSRRQDSTSAAVPAAAATRNVAAIYLLPFLAVLATSLLTHAASSGFEYLYPLRLAVAIAVLVYFRADYRTLDWRFGWLGPLAGAAVFALWLGIAHWPGHTAAASTLPGGLASLSPATRLLWIASRALAAILTVPIAEELAFRGYLARRVISPDVETVPFASLNLLAIAVSSVAFGLLHGSLWPAGILAGLVFALVAKARNRIGEAVAAHATANLLIALWVLTRADYSLW